MGQDPKLNLGIVGTDEFIPCSGDECLPELPPHGLPDRDILQIRLCAAQPSRCRHSLLEMGTNSSIRPDQRSQSFHISAPQLRQCPVLQNKTDDRILRSKFLQNIRTGAVSPLRLLSGRQSQLLEENIPQLLRRIDVENFPAEFVNFSFQPVHFGGECLPDSF